MKDVPNRNRPIRPVLKEYCEREKGKVVKARDEMHRRFDGLDWSVQKKILMAHLQSSPTDRKWALKILLRRWDKSFETLIQNIWEDYHCEQCAWVINRHFKKDYIMAHFDELSTGKSYFFLCLRFGNDSDFHIDKKRLEPLDCLFVYYRLGKTMNANEACALLNEITLNAIKNYWSTDLFIRQIEVGRTTDISPTRIRTWGSAFYYITQMKIEPAVSQISKWCNDVTAIMMASDEWKHLQLMSLNDQQYNRRAYLIALKYMGCHLPIFLIDSNSQENSTLKYLIQKLELEMDFDHMISEIDEKYK